MEDSPLNDIRIGHISAGWAKQTGLETVFLERAGSTNDVAKEQAFNLSDEHLAVVYFTDHQTAGRGRGENTWTTGRAGSALLSSWSLALDRGPQPISSPRVGLALYRAALATWPYLPWSLKSPNDLYLGDKKVAGLLLETLSQGDRHRLIVGLGLNVLDKPADVATATSLIENLPAGAPLLGDDWVGFLERWLSELTGLFTAEEKILNSTERMAIKSALNLRPSLKKKIDEVLPDGGLRRGDQTTPWTEI